MPGGNGYELADQARMMRPDLSVLLVTGDEAIKANPSSLPMLFKPYTREQLSIALKDAHPTLLLQ